MKKEYVLIAFYWIQIGVMSLQLTGFLIVFLSQLDQEAEVAPLFSPVSRNPFQVFPFLQIVHSKILVVTFFSVIHSEFRRSSVEKFFLSLPFDTMAAVAKLKATRDPPIFLSGAILFEDYPQARLYYQADPAQPGDRAPPAKKADVPFCPDPSDKERALSILLTRHLQRLCMLIAALLTVP